MSGLSVGGAGNNVAGIQVGSDSGALGISSFPKAESGEKSGAATGFGAPVAGSPVEFGSGSKSQGKDSPLATLEKLPHAAGADSSRLASLFGKGKDSSSETGATGSTGQGEDPRLAALEKIPHAAGADRLASLFGKGKGKEVESGDDSSPVGNASTTGGIMAPQGQSVRALGEDLAKSRGASITGVHAALPAQTESDPIATAKSGSTSSTGSISLGLVGEIKQLLAKLTKGESGQNLAKGESSQNLGSASSSTGIPAEVENSSV